MRPDVALVYRYWSRFPPARVEVAMDVVGVELSARLARRGHRVTVYSEAGVRRWTSRSDGLLTYRGLPTLVDPLWHKLRGLVPLGRPSDASDGSVLPMLSYVLLVAADIRRRRTPIIHVCINDEFLPLLRALNPRARIVLHMHDHKQAYRSPSVLRRRLSNADAIVGCSEFVTDRVRAAVPELAPRCRTILNAVESDRYERRSRDGTRRIVFVGRLTPEKGVHTLIEAFSRVAPRHPAAELLLYGQDRLPSLQEVEWEGNDSRFDGLRDFYADPPSYASYLRTLAPDGLRSRVRFLGPASHEDVPGLLAEADALVFPSVWDEPFGLPVIEALAAGIPVVATRVGGIRETVIDGESGLLVRPGDVAGLAAALDRLLSDPALSLRLGEAGRKRAVRRFDWARSSAEWSDLYCQLATSRSGETAAAGPTMRLAGGRVVPARDTPARSVGRARRSMR